MVKYKFALNIIIAVLWTGSSLAFNQVRIDVFTAFARQLPSMDVYAILSAKCAGLFLTDCQTKRNETKQDADTPWLAAFLCINLFIIAMGTFHIGYQAEAVYRNSVLISAQLFESKQSIEHILLSMLPARLLLSPIRYAFNLPIF